MSADSTQDPNQALWGTRRNSSHPWPANRLDGVKWAHSELWWPGSYAGHRLCEWHDNHGQRALTRADFAFGLAMLVGADEELLDRLQHELLEHARRLEKGKHGK